jgi:hypothetical protein
LVTAARAPASPGATRSAETSADAGATSRHSRPGPLSFTLAVDSANPSVSTTPTSSSALATPSPGGAAAGGSQVTSTDSAGPSGSPPSFPFGASCPASTLTPPRLARLRVGPARDQRESLHVARRAQAERRDGRPREVDLEPDFGLPARGDGRFEVEGEGVVAGASTSAANPSSAVSSTGRAAPVERRADDERLAPAERDGGVRLGRAERVRDAEGRDELLAALLDPPADGASRSARPASAPPAPS